MNKSVFLISSTQTQQLPSKFKSNVRMITYIRGGTIIDNIRWWRAADGGAASRIIKGSLKSHCRNLLVAPLALRHTTALGTPDPVFNISQ